MATRSEESKANEQRRRRAKKKTQASKTSTKAPAGSRAKKHAGKKATYALEESATARPSRKSTRKSANRAKPDASLNSTEAMKKGAPQARFRKAKARRTRVKGTPS